MATHNFNIRELTESQSQKATSVNEGFFILDTVAGGYVLGVSATPPVSAADGTSWIVASGGTGEWSARDTNIALRIGGAWRYVEPKAGLSFINAQTDETLKYSGSIWQPVAAGFTETSADAKYLQPANITGGGGISVSVSGLNVLVSANIVAASGSGGGSGGLVFLYGETADNNLSTSPISTSNFATKGAVYTAERNAVIGEVYTVIQTVSSSDVYAVNVTELSATTTVKSILLSANYSSTGTGVTTNDVFIKAPQAFPVSAGKKYGFTLTYATGNPTSPARLPFPSSNTTGLGNIFTHNYAVRQETSAITTGITIDEFSNSGNTYWGVKFGDGDLSALVSATSGGGATTFLYGKTASNGGDSGTPSTSLYASKGMLYRALRDVAIGGISTDLQTVSGDTYAIQIVGVSGASVSGVVDEVLFSANYTYPSGSVSTNTIEFVVDPAITVTSGRTVAFLATLTTGTPTSASRPRFLSSASAFTNFEYIGAIRDELNSVSIGTALSAYDTAVTWHFKIDYSIGDISGFVSEYSTEHSITWTSTASYAHGDTVQITSAVWFCLTPGTTETPGTGSAWVQIGTI